ncbi:hypothetical protein FJZ28_05275 [Candidatus Peregrinibacteria bacterium]|nr:hypothetical protein [Candidatus Peregrinibacteria bacterium]
MEGPLVEGFVDTIDATDAGLHAITGHGILYAAGVLAVIGVGIYGLRKLYQGVTGAGK